MVLTRTCTWGVLLGLAALPGVALANPDVIKLTQDAKNWAMQAGNMQNHRYSSLKQISIENVKDLRVAWAFSTGVLRGHEGGPLVIGDTLYIHSPFPNKVFAIALADQQIKWKYEPKQDPTVIPVMCCDTVNRGLAYADGKIFLQQPDTNLVALDAKTGKELWKVKNGDPKKGETNTNAPHIFKDKVITGISGGEFGVRGYVAAYDIKTGKQVWKAYSTGPDAEMLMDPDKTMTWTDGRMAPVGRDSSLKTWQGDQWKIGGGTTWGWYSYDPKLNLMYYGSGNPSTWNPVQRPGDNKWSMTIFARDVDTGQAKWAYQMTPHDEWDFAGVNEIILLGGISVKGKPRNVVVHFDRNGFGYTLDRATGELLVAAKYDPKVNWATHVDMKTGRPQVVKEYSTQAQGQDVNAKGICPAALGTKDQQPAAYNPANKMFYVPTNHVCMDYEPFKVEYTAGQPYVGATLSMYPPPGDSNMGNFIAWDNKTGKIVWSNKEQFSVWSGALATAGGVVFYGTLEGFLKAVDAKTGKELYKFKTPSGIIGNVTTYEQGGRQYVAVLSGVGGWAGIGLAAGLTDPSAGLGAVGGYAGLSTYTHAGGTLTVFALPQ